MLVRVRGNNLREGDAKGAIDPVTLRTGRVALAYRGAHTPIWFTSSRMPFTRRSCCGLSFALTWNPQTVKLIVAAGWRNSQSSQVHVPT